MTGHSGEPRGSNGSRSSQPVRRVAVVVLALAALVTAGCGRGGTGGGGGGGEPLKIGGVGPLSQPGAVQAGQDMKWAMETAVADVNAEGKILGKQVKLVFEDTEGKPEAGAAVAKKLVEDEKVAGVVGEYHSSAALAQIPVYAEHGTPFVVVDAYADTITAGDPKDPKLPARPPSVFRIAPTTSYDMQLHAGWLVDGLKADSVVQIYEATDYGTGQATAMKKMLAGKGVKLTQIQIELNQPDYKSILSRIKNEQPDVKAVMLSVTGETSYTVASNAFDVGLLDKDTVCVANQVAQDDKAFWRAVPEGTGCVFRVAGLMPSQYGAAASKLAKRYTGKFGNAPKAWVFESYDAVRLLVDAIKRAGSTDPKRIVTSLEKSHYQGIQGTYEFPYGAGNPVPADQPGWLWHQWPKPAMQLAEYTAKGQQLAGATVVWPPDKQSKPGTAYAKPGT
jgi:branched-chain amino acid transport system substrate-binding protein